MLLLDKRYQKSFHVHISIKTLSYKQIKQPIRSHEGIPVDENLEKKANELEEEIIKKEILLILTKNIEPAL